jgi:hypothetical protein
VLSIMNIKKTIRKKLKGTSFWKAKELIHENWKKALCILCADALFFIVLICLRNFLLGRNLTSAEIYGISPAAAILFSASYVIFLLLLYSLLKYIILIIIKSMEKKAGFDISGYLRFVLLNAVILLKYFILIMVLSTIVALAVKEENLAIASDIIFFIAVFFIYFYANIAQMLFIMHGKIIKPLKESYTIIFKDGGIYAPLILNFTAVFVLYLIVSLPLLFAGADSTVLRTVYMILAAVLVYAAVFFNRLQLLVKLTNFK